MTAHIIGATLIEKDGKYLFLQEAQNSVDNCKGKWGTPGGHVDPGETIMQAAIREAFEETGCKVELTGICQIGTMADPEYTFIVVVFLARATEVIDGFTSEETAATRWLSYEEICAMRDQLRSPELAIGSIENFQNGLIAPLSLIETYPPLSN